MALAIGKVTILVGAGIIGSVLIKDGGLPSVSDLFSGALKIAVKQIRRDDSSRSPSSSKPQNDSLLAQVNSLRKELELLASNGSVTIISASRSGRGTYAAPAVVIIVVGYGYIWWKGWKLSDMMFATRRSLSDACTSVAKQLDQVYSSVTDTKRHLSSRIDRVDCNIDECAELTSSTRDEVSQLQGDLGKFLLDVKSVRHTVLTLEEKFGEIEKKQEVTTSGVRVLVDFVLENGDTRAFIKESPSTSSRPALEAPLTPALRESPSTSSRPALEAPLTPALRPTSLPPKIVELEPASPSSSAESPKVSPRLRGTASLASGLKDVIQVTSSIDEAISSSEIPPIGIRPVEDTKSNGSSSSSRFGWRLPSLSAPFLSRTNSVTGSFKL